MNISLNKPETARDAAKRRWPVHLFNGRIRTSTVVLIIAFAVVWWVYDTYRTEPTPPAAPQVVPPGFIPDPAYTWVPRTKLQQPPVTVTETVTPTPTTTEAPPPTTETPPPPSPVPGFPFCPPLCPPPAPAPPEQVPPPAPGLPQSPPLPGAPHAPAPPPPGPPTSYPAAP